MDMTIAIAGVALAFLMYTLGQKFGYAAGFRNGIRYGIQSYEEAIFQSIEELTKNSPQANTEVKEVKTDV